MKFTDEFQRNFILEFLRDNIFNVKNNGVLYCPQLNRFKIISKNRNNEMNLIYSNYYHLKLNLKKLSTKNRIKISSSHEKEEVKLFFDFNSRKTLITDPVRGKNCSHFQFTDLREYYKSMKIINQGFQSKILFSCPICGN